MQVLFLILNCDAVSLLKNEISYEEIEITKDECNRSNTDIEGLINLKPVMG